MKGQERWKNGSPKAAAVDARKEMLRLIEELAYLRVRKGQGTLVRLCAFDKARAC